MTPAASVELVETGSGIVSLHRYVATGDSFTEGVDDPGDPKRPALAPID